MGCAGSSSAHEDPLAAAPPIGEQTRREINRQQQASAGQTPQQQTQGLEDDKELQAALAYSRFTAEEEVRAHAQPTGLLRQSSEDELQAALALSRTMQGAPTVWLKGVGTAFEALYERSWAPVTEKHMVDPLGRLCADKTLDRVEYMVAGRAVRTTILESGLLSQVDVQNGSKVVLRLVPFFFEYEERDFAWRPIVEPEAITALTAVLATSEPKSYVSGGASYVAQLVNEQGLILQRDVASGATCELRVTPIGPDGSPHFEYLEAEVDWKPGRSTWQPVAPQAVGMLAACAAGLGDAFYTVNGFTYHAKLGADGFVDQTNLQTGSRRPVRPAPWLGHGLARVVDSTNGWVPAAVIVDAEPAPMGIAMGTAFLGGGGQNVGGAPTSYQPAASFYAPPPVMMGTALDPVELVPIGTGPGTGTGTNLNQPQSLFPTPSQPAVYYYQP